MCCVCCATVVSTGCNRSEFESYSSIQEWRFKFKPVDPYPLTWLTCRCHAGHQRQQQQPQRSSASVLHINTGIYRTLHPEYVIDIQIVFVGKVIWYGVYRTIKKSFIVLLFTLKLKDIYQHDRHTCITNHTHTHTFSQWHDNHHGAITMVGLRYCYKDAYSYYCVISRTLQLY